MFHVRLVGSDFFFFFEVLCSNGNILPNHWHAHSYTLDYCRLCTVLNQKYPISAFSIKCFVRKTPYTNQYDFIGCEIFTGHCSIPHGSPTGLDTQTFVILQDHFLPKATYLCIGSMLASQQYATQLIIPGNMFTSKEMLIKPSTQNDDRTVTCDISPIGKSDATV